MVFRRTFLSEMLVNVVLPFEEHLTISIIFCCFHNNENRRFGNYFNLKLS